MPLLRVVDCLSLAGTHECVLQAQGTEGAQSPRCTNSLVEIDADRDANPRHTHEASNDCSCYGEGIMGA